MNTETRKQKVMDDIREVLVTRGHKCRDGGDGRANGLDVVDGHLTFFYCTEESTKQGFSVTKGTGRLRIKIGNIGDVQQFPEPKTGFDVGKIADAIEKMVARKKSAEESRLEVEKARNVNEPLAKRLNKEFGLSDYGQPRACVGSSGELRVEFKGDVDESKARRILASIVITLKQVS
jgi:hypothetical protein